MSHAFMTCSSVFPCLPIGVPDSQPAKHARAHACAQGLAKAKEDGAEKPVIRSQTYRFASHLCPLYVHFAARCKAQAKCSCPNCTKTWNGPGNRLCFSCLRGVRAQRRASQLITADVVLASELGLNPRRFDNSYVLNQQMSKFHC